MSPMPFLMHFLIGITVGSNCKASGEDSETGELVEGGRATPWARRQNIKPRSVCV